MHGYVLSTLLIGHMMEMAYTAEPFARNCHLKNLFRLTGFFTINSECLK